MSNSNMGKLPQIAIAGTEVQQITYRDEPVVTFAMVDQVHKRPDGTAKRSFDENRDRFIEGEDFIELGRDEIRTNLPDGIFSKYAPKGHLLTRRGYLKLVKPMNDDRAWEVQGEMIDRYFAIERIAAALDFADYRAAREHRLQFAQNLKLAALAGLAGAEAAIAANQATARATGFDTLEAMGVKHIVAPQNDALVVPTDIGNALGVSAVKVNHLLQEGGFQRGDRDHKNKPYWVPTAKGEDHGGTMVVVQRGHGVTGSARQLKWPSSMIEVVRDLLEQEAG